MHVYAELEQNRLRSKGIILRDRPSPYVKFRHIRITDAAVPVKGDIVTHKRRKKHGRVTNVIYNGSWDDIDYEICMLGSDPPEYVNSTGDDIKIHTVSEQNFINRMMYYLTEGGTISLDSPATAKYPRDVHGHLLKITNVSHRHKNRILAGLPMEGGVTGHELDVLPLEQLQKMPVHRDTSPTDQLQT